MAATKTARPARSPARVKAARPVRKAAKQAPKKPAKKVAGKAVKKTAAKKAVANKPPKPATAKSGKTPFTAATRKTADAVVARRATQVRTQRRVEYEDVITDPDDHVAQQKLAKIRRTTAVDKVDRPPPAAGAALIVRVSTAVERELMQIESIVGGHHVQKGQRTEAERRARTLASLARTLAEMRRLRAAEEPQRAADGPSAARDLDAFRRILWKRLEGMVGRTTPFPADGNEPGGDR